MTARLLASSLLAIAVGTACSGKDDDSSPAGDAPAAASRPVVVEFHGGGFTGGKATSSTTAQIDNMLSNGVAFVSMDYRLVATKYYYRDAAGAEREEQFIHAGEDGRLTLDGEAAPASSYAPNISVSAAHVPAMGRFSASSRASNCLVTARRLLCAGHAVRHDIGMYGGQRACRHGRL